MLGHYYPGEQAPTPTLPRLRGRENDAVLSPPLQAGEG